MALTETAGRPVGGARRWWALLGYAAAVTLVAVIGGLAAGNAGDFYQDLTRPSWAPPAWLFGPVWTTLYAMIALAGWLAYLSGAGRAAQLAYAGQLLLNVLWTPLFFGGERFGLALLDIIALWLLIGATVALFWRRSRVAALLLVPYWAWVSYATALTWSILRLN